MKTYLLNFLMILSFAICTFSCSSIDAVYENLGIQDPNGCKIRAKPKQPYCNPGEVALRVNDEACNGTGFLDAYTCSVCNGKRKVPRTVGASVNPYNPYQRVNYVRYVNCPECCGRGKMVHKICNGQGWIWKCESSSNSNF